MEKKLIRRRRAMRARMKIKELVIPRLCVFRTPQHIYAQLIINEQKGDKVLVSASTLDKEVKSNGGTAGNVKSATLVGKFIAVRALAAGVTRVAFDRAGFKYHGCIKALADAAREGGLEF